MRIIVVDSDERFAGVLAAGLSGLGHRRVISRPDEALEQIEARPFDLAVVDVDDDGGRFFLDEYRRIDPRLVVIALTVEPTVETAVDTLGGGASARAIDYIQKPDPQLVRRIDRNAQRRWARIERGLFILDTVSRFAYFDETELDLTDHEFDIFLAFMRNPNRELTYEDIAWEVYDQELSHEDAYVKFRSPVSRLRTKLRQAAGFNVLSYHADGQGIRFVPGGTHRRRRPYRPRIKSKS